LEVDAQIVARDCRRNVLREHGSVVDTVVDFAADYRYQNPAKLENSFSDTRNCPQSLMIGAEALGFELRETKFGLFNILVIMA
jgi:hypothetical protein